MGAICNCQLCECTIELVDYLDGDDATVCFECKNNNHAEDLRD